MSVNSLNSCEKRVSIPRLVRAATLAICSCAIGMHAGATELSDEFSMHIDAGAKELLGETGFAEVMAFFHAAEAAVETEDLDTLMTLYSDRYSDGTHDKNSAAEIWTRIFSTFDSMATHHSMKLVNISGKKNVVILRCSGLLLGVPNSQTNRITIDTWDEQDHILAREGGKWVLLGTYGGKNVRPGVEKPMHPLF